MFVLMTAWTAVRFADRALPPLNPNQPIWRRSMTNFLLLCCSIETSYHTTSWLCLELYSQGCFATIYLQVNIDTLAADTEKLQLLMHQNMHVPRYHQRSLEHPISSPNQWDSRSNKQLGYRRWLTIKIQILGLDQDGPARRRHPLQWSHYAEDRIHRTTRREYQQTHVVAANMSS